MLNRATLLALPCLLAVVPMLYAAEEGQDLSKARDALTKQDNDADTEKALEQVFQAAEKNYSLLRSGDVALNYNFDYTYYGDQVINLEIVPTVDSTGAPTGASSIRNANVNPVASHTYTNSFNLDYGLLNNLTGSFRLPFVAKYDTEEDMNVYSLGDVSTSLRWQPFEYVPGAVSQTYFASASLKTGDSPYEIDLSKHLSTGAGYYSLSLGGSYSKVMDPVVLFGSASYGYNFDAEGLNQVRGSNVLKKVSPGSSLSFSMGFAYSLSYDVSLSASFQGSYNTETRFKLLTQEGVARRSVSNAQMSGIMNFALGVRVSPKTIANINVGFGMTELSPDILLGLSLPIDLEGIKPSRRN